MFILFLAVAFIQKVLMRFLISSNRWTKLFSWTWSFEISLQIAYKLRMSNGSEGCNSKKAALFGRLAIKATKIQKFRKTIRFVCLRIWQMHQYFQKKLPLTRMSKRTDYGHTMRAFFKNPKYFGRVELGCGFGLYWIWDLIIMCP